MIDSNFPSTHQPATLVELLRWRAREQATGRAYTFLVDGKIEGATLTYGELDRQARAIGAWLQAHNARGERALLLYPQSLEVLAALFGCLYAGVIAIPAPAPEASRLKRTLPRLQAIAKDARAGFVLTNRAIIELVGSSRQQIPEFQAMEWTATEDITPDLAEQWREPILSPNQLAYLQYTSGSTSSPKGVTIGHDNILFHCAYLQKSCGYNPDSATVTWMPYFHDYGLVEGMLEPLYNGTPCYLMSPFSFIRRPFHWLEAISNYRATHSQAPNFAYDQCVRRISSQQRQQLDLSGWRAAGNAAEPINPKILAEFAETFAPCGFRPEAFCPAYGLAEATLLVSFSPQGEAPSVLNLEPTALERDWVVEAPDHQGIVRQVPSCGRLVGGMKVAIVSPQTLKHCAPDEVGEIWVSDPSVAGGYWQRPQETEVTFAARIADTGEGPFLRTGDLGFLRDGQLFITGRLKDVVIVRGTNHYPQDLEWTVQQAHPALRPENGAAFSLSVAGEERLVVVQEVERGYLKNLPLDEVVESIRREIFEQHEIQVYAIALIKPGTLPKTSSGKIQRRACCQEFQQGTLSAIATWQSPLAVPGESDGEAGGSPAAPALSAPLPSAPSLMGAAPAARSHPAHPSPEASQRQADELIQWLRDYGKERVNSRLIDERRCLPPYIVLDLGNRGLLGLQVPPDWGGLGLNNASTMRIMEQLGAIDQAMALVVFNHNILGIRPILRYGGSSLRDELLPLLASGRELAAFALSEPGAGSNPRGIATQAIAQGDGTWELRGTKSWSGLAAWAGAINVFAQTVDSQGKPQGISGFTLRQGTLGMRQGPEAMTMGMRGMVQNTIYLEGVRAGRQNLLGEPSSGMAAAQDAMMYGRLGIGAFALGGMKRCAQLMLRYASRRSISTGRLLDNPVTLARMSQTQAAIASVEALIGKLSQLLDRGQAVPVEPYIVCKIAGAEFFWQAADSLIQLLGGRGYVEPNLAPQLLRDARVCRIFEGPTETLNTFMGSRVINQPQELVQFISEVLECPGIAQNLAETAGQIQDRCLSRQFSFGDRTAAIRWAAALAGEVATYAILLACVQQAAAASGSPHYQLAGEWLRLKLAEKRDLALSQNAGESYISSAESLTRLFSDYSQAIGDVEQTLAGEDLGLDELLQPQPLSWESSLAVAAPVASPLEPAAVESPTPPAGEEVVQTAASIENWIVQRLVREWKVPAAAIAPSKSFADYGLDSVMAVNLAQELEDWLDCPVEATIVWNFPTIASLSRHLAAQLSLNPPPATAAAPAEAAAVPEAGTEDLAALSTDTLAQLLAEEIARSQAPSSV